MAGPSISQFATTENGVAFYRAYDAVLAKWPHGTTSMDIESLYGTTRVNVCGPLGAPPVVLLPGAGATSTSWFDNVASLSRQNRVYAVDLIGDAGRSLSTGQPVQSVDDLLDWLRSVVDGLKLNSPSLIAHSYGAMIALAYALRAPECVSRLVLIDPNSCFAGMRAPYLIHAIPILVRPTEKRERAFITWETDGVLLDEDWLTMLALGAAHFPKSKTVVPKRPSSKALSAFTVDTTVILAGRSKVHDSTRVEAAVRAHLPHARTVIFDTATHHTLPMVPAAELNSVLEESLTV